MNDLKETKIILLSSWKLFKARATDLIALIFAYLVISALVLGILYSLPKEFPLKNELLSFMLLFLYSAFSICHVRNMSHAIKRQPFSVPKLNEERKCLLSHLLATILYLTIITVGTLFFIIPGIYVAVRLQFYPYAIIEEGKGPIESIRASWALTHNATTELLILTAYSVIALCVGLILFILGLFVAIPYILMIQCYTYKILSNG